MFHVNRILCPFEPERDAEPNAHPALVQSLHLADRLGATVYVVPLPLSTGDAAASPSRSGAGSQGGSQAGSQARSQGGPQGGHRAGSQAAPRAASATAARAGSADLRPSPAPVSHAQRAEAARAVAQQHGFSAPIVAPTRELSTTPSTTDLIAYAETHELDLLVVDTPADRGPIPPMASDPVRTFVEQAPMPVFVAEHTGDPSTFRRILVPIDFSEHARDALQHAKYLAHLYGASLDLLHVIERPHYVALNPTDMLAFSDATLTERKAGRRVETFFQHTNGVDVPARTHLTHGDAADQIVHFACEHAIDLVVLSTHGVIGRPQRPLGTVADKVLRRVTCPVVLTRAFGRSLV